MRFYGQRWVYLIGNTIVKVDNAFALNLWTQERLLVNEEPAQESAGWARFFQRYQEPWLTPIGEGELHVTLRSQGAGIGCIATLDGRILEPEAKHQASWRGPARSWPEEAEWALQEGRSWWSR